MADAAYSEAKLSAPGEPSWPTEQELSAYSAVVGAVLWKRYHLEGPDAQDILQDALLALLRNWGQIHDPRAWIASTACVLAKKHFTVKQRERRRAEMVLRAQVPQEVPADPMAQDRHAEFALAYGRLRPACKELIAALFLREMSHREASRELGMRPGTMSRRKETCLRAFRTLFEDQCRLGRGA